MIPPKNIIERLFGVKTDTKTNLITNCCILVFIILCFWLLPKYSDKQRKTLAEDWNQSKFSGIVDTLQIDFSNHAATTIYFTNGNKRGPLHQTYYYYSIKKNDSLFKIPLNDTVYVKRGNKIIKLH